MNELKTLRSWRNDLLDENDIPKSYRYWKLVIHTWLVIAFIITFVLFYNQYLSIKGAFIAGMIWGLLIAFGAYLVIQGKCWPMLKPHINLDSLEKRIHEIET